MSSLKNKRILITAGPTWVPIDDVRVISNISSGELGMLLAREGINCGARVEMFLGPVSRPLDKGLDRAKVRRFTYFDDLYRMVTDALKMHRYDIILHCAAVSDYLPQPVRGKISSEKNKISLRLNRAPKIVEVMRRLAPETFLVMFKLEGGVTDAVLLKRALEAKKRAGADLVIANRFVHKKYRGFVLGSDNILAKTISKKLMAKKLFQILNKKAV